jgi:hypothetical protein
MLMLSDGPKLRVTEKKINFFDSSGLLSSRGHPQVIS